MKSGCVVYLTKHYSEWVKSLHSNIDLPLEHRIAKIVKIFDWDTDEGKLLLKERERNGKWKNLDSRLFKYILNVYYPELSSKNAKKRGLILPEVVPLNFPGTEFPLFEEYPQKLIDDLVKPLPEDIFTLKISEV